MDQLNDYLAKLRTIVDSEKDTDTIVDEVGKTDFSIDPLSFANTDLSLNYMTLLDYIGWLNFDWREEAYDNEDGFANEGVQTIRQMLNDIDNNNQYKPKFRVKLKYSKTDEADEWLGEDSWQDIDATNIENAKTQADRLRATASKELPDSPGMTLFDTILFMEVFDNKGKLRHTQKIEPEYGAYFNSEHPSAQK